MHCNPFTRWLNSINCVKCNFFLKALCIWTANVECKPLWQISIIVRKVHTSGYHSNTQDKWQFSQNSIFGFYSILYVYIFNLMPLCSAKSWASSRFSFVLVDKQVLKELFTAAKNKSFNYEIVLQQTFLYPSVLWELIFNN